MVNLRVGLVGFGAMGRNHARVLSSLEGVELIGICDPVAAMTNKIILKEVDQLIEMRPDYCVVATPTITHEDIALRFSESGIHALIEKPLASNFESALRIAKAFRQRGLLGAVGHIERFNSSLRQARERVHEGQLGEILQIATRRQGPFPTRIGDVGVVKDLATHDIDSTMWLSDSPYSTVSAQTAVKAGRSNEDLLVAIGRLQNGTITNHLVNWLSPFKERITMITGEKGAFVADSVQTDLIFYNNGNVLVEWNDLARFKGVSEGDSIRYAFKKQEPLLVEHIEFLKALRGEEGKIVSLEAGAEVVKVADAMITSSLIQQSVTLGEFQQ